MKTVAVLPAYNLEEKIGSIVDRTKPFVDQVIVVADGSRDRTAEAARKAGALAPEPEQVRGKGFAVIKPKEVLNEVRAFSGDIVDFNAIKDVVKGQEVVFHLAALIACRRET